MTSFIHSNVTGASLINRFVIAYSQFHAHIQRYFHKSVFAGAHKYHQRSPNGHNDQQKDDTAKQELDNVRFLFAAFVREILIDASNALMGHVKRV